MVLERPWVLAIDFGTSFTVAAGAFDGESGTVVEIDGERRLPSAVLIDGTEIVVGRVAEEMSSARPGDVLRAPKSRLGDQGAVVLAGKTFPAGQLVAAILAAVYGYAVREYGSEPREVRLSHPATWTRTKLSRLLDAASQAGLPDAILVPEPVAAALAYWQRGELQPGQLVAIYDLGGGTFDTAMLQLTGQGFQIVGRPQGDVSIGGELFDEILVQIIGEKLSAALWEDIQLAQDESWVRIGSVLRAEARRAKETMSSFRYAEALVPAPSGIERVRVERAEFEERIGPHLADSVSLLHRCILEAGLTPAQVAAVQLVGGSSRIPAVESTLREAFPDTILHRRGDPKSAVALGALLARSVSVTPRPTGFGSSEEALKAQQPVAPPSSAALAPPAGYAPPGVAVQPPGPPARSPVRQPPQQVTPRSRPPGPPNIDESNPTRMAPPPGPLREDTLGRVLESPDGEGTPRSKAGTNRSRLLILAGVIIGLLSAKTHAFSGYSDDSSDLYGAWPSDVSTLLLAASPLLALLLAPSTIARGFLIGITVGYAVVLDGALAAWDLRYVSAGINPAWVVLKVLITIVLGAACLSAVTGGPKMTRARRGQVVLLCIGGAGLIAFAFLQKQFTDQQRADVRLRLELPWKVLLLTLGVLIIVSAIASVRSPVVRSFSAGVALTGGLYTLRLTTEFVDQDTEHDFWKPASFGAAAIVVSAVLIFGALLCLRDCARQLRAARAKPDSIER